MKKLVKGSRLDELPPDVPEGAWGLAKNIVNYKKFGGISNENGADNITPVAVPATIYTNFPTKPVNGIIPITKGSVYFFAPSIIGNDSEIGIVDELNRYHTIVKDIAGRVVLDLDINSPIQGTYEYKFNNNLIIAWRDSKNNPRILNTDCLPFTLDANYNVVIGDLSKAQALIKLFPNVLTPEVTDLFLTDNGGALKTGTYFPIVSYELEDKSVTSWLKVYNPFPVVQDSSTIPFREYDGDFAGITTSKKLRISFSGIDTNYLNLRFGVITLQAGVYTAYFVSAFKISGTTIEFDFTGSESTLTPITLNEVLIPNAVYEKAGTITNLLGKLYLGDVEKKQQINYQQYANMIGIEWVQGNEISLTDVQETSYKDEKVVFFDKSFRTNEVMALYMAFKYKDGTYSDAFHITGRAPLVGETDLISGTGDPEVDFLGANVRRFQIHETAAIDGTMGYWENETEFYPNTSDFDSTALGGSDLRGLAVRHHKFPELKTFVKNGMPYFHKLTAIGNNLNLDTPVVSATVGTEDFYDFAVALNTTPFTVTYPGNKNHVNNPVVTTTAIVFNGTIFYSITGIGIGETATIEFDVERGGDNITPHVQIDITFAMTGGTGNFVGSYVLPQFYANLVIFDFIEIELKTNTNGSGTILFDLTGTLLNGIDALSTNGSKALGIKVSNVIIPPAIADLVDSWEIFYAKRDNSSIRMIGQDIPVASNFPTTIKGAPRFHDFDLVYNQANLRGSYLKPQFVAGGTMSSVGNESVPGAIIGEKIEAIQTFYYVGENTLAPIDNTNRETCIYIAIRKDPNYITQELRTDYSSEDILMDICIYRTDSYKSFDAQSLASTGRGIKVVASGLQAVQDIYGGDIFINPFGFIVDTVSKYEHYHPHESAANIGLRMDDEIQFPPKYYFPKHNSTDPIVPSVSYYGYNNDYTAINSLNKVFPRAISFNDCLSDIFQFPQLIAFSLSDANESLKLNWRIFPINSYYDQLPKDKGKLWNLLGSNRTLYIQQEYALLIAEVKDSLEGGGSATIALGVSDIFDRPPTEVIPTSEGYVGSQCQFATVMTPMGYVTIDRQQGKVFVFSKDGGLREISNEGYYNYFRDNTQTTNKDVDNPFVGNGFMVAYDLELRRLMIVKKDAVKEFTLSYCHDTKAWLGFHDYHPNYIFTTRNGLYAGVNTNFKLYKLNSKTLKGIFFDGVMYNSYIDIPFAKPQDASKYFNNFNWITHVRDLTGVMKEGETLTGLMIYNNNQCSGVLNLQADNGLWYGKDARSAEETWNYNKFRDLVNDVNLPFLDDNGDLIVANINNNKAWFDKSKFISKFVIARFIYNNVNQRDLHIVSVDSNMRQSNR